VVNTDGENKWHSSVQAYTKHLFIYIYGPWRGNREPEDKEKSFKILSTGHGMAFADMISQQLQWSVLGFHKNGTANSKCWSWRGFGSLPFSFFFFFFPFFIRYLAHLHFQCYTKSPPYPPTPTPLPAHSPFLALAFPCSGAYKVCVSNGPLFPVMAD
jgi:hypothetical protein